ncbi:hypothetical protein MsAg5_17020 [Methanosarcinaceae archaeon Ag5]|uniref:Immunoglobulin domain-containing protein n=1 Tax=Methanolapillus africanus TaxID=3028297 RepID=A0AAE4SEM4_9EURY|nr:hypothetical protein [Methanosarcinaceae archaeon Ag5]
MITGTQGDVKESNAATLTVVSTSDAVTITAQPVSQIVVEGETATFNVAANNAASYQWQKSTDSGVTFSDISSATSDSYTTPATVLADDQTQFRVVITGTEGDVKESNAATLTVVGAGSNVVIITQPEDIVVPEGSSASFTVEANANAASYQWYEWDGTTLTIITGETSATYTISSTTVAMDSTQYKVVVTGTSGDTVESDAATLTVIDPADAATITAQPTDKTVSEGQTATFEITADNAASYQWQESTNNGLTFTNISGEISSTYTTPAADLSMDGTQYRVIVIGNLGDVVTSDEAVLTVVQATGFTATVASVTEEENHNATFEVTIVDTDSVSTTPYAIQWQVNKNDGNGFVDVTTPDGTVLNAGIKFETGVTDLSMDGWQYRAIVTDYASLGATSIPGTLTVIEFEITSYPQNRTVTVGQTATFSVTATGKGLAYQWQVDMNDGNGWMDVPNYGNDATYTTPVTDASMSGWRYIVIVENIYGDTDSSLSQPAILTVNDKSGSGGSTGNATIKDNDGGMLMPEPPAEEENNSSGEGFENDSNTGSNGTDLNPDSGSKIPSWLWILILLFAAIIVLGGIWFIIVLKKRKEDEGE